MRPGQLRHTRQQLSFSRRSIFLTCLVCPLQVEVVGVNEALKKIAYDALTTRPNFAYTLKEVESDLKRVFATGACACIWCCQRQPIQSSGLYLWL